MRKALSGIHHITAYAGDAQQNLDFYTGLLGLRLVKRTVNFDNPDIYHLYYGDEMGRPGTLLTFFPASGTPRGRRGAGQVTTVALAVPLGALGYWHERLTAAGVAVQESQMRFGESLLAFEDPDGLALEIIASQEADLSFRWTGGSVPTEHAICGVHSVTMSVASVAASAHLLTTHMGFHLIADEDGRSRYRTDGGTFASLVDLLQVPGAPRGYVAAGTVHHVAWRTADDASEEMWRQYLASVGQHVTPIQDRQYFRSIYFREPGGVLFEIATDPPGFAIDESVTALGASLKLPPWLEPHRARIEQLLPSLTLSST